jgi:hypothetical protein
MVNNAEPYGDNIPTETAALSPPVHNYGDQTTDIISCTRSRIVVIVTDARYRYRVVILGYGKTLSQVMYIGYKVQEKLHLGVREQIW